ncbi:hypothetical protein R1flu_026735 [Riccia fluitans]|uniref:GAG-pre-integrase domain-containing protein n=1 Tax=Riccia fluitans TaxID=41844 RepID=A0ABD1XGT8_9MARC
MAEWLLAALLAFDDVYSTLLSKDIRKMVRKTKVASTALIVERGKTLDKSGNGKAKGGFKEQSKSRGKSQHEKGYKFNVEQNFLCVMADDKVILRGRHRRNLYVLEGSTVFGEVHVTASQGEMAHLWHPRLGHMSEKGMEILRKQDLLSGLRFSKLEFCEHCVFGKHKQSAFGVGIHRSIDVLEYAYSNMWGKSPIPSYFGKEYYVSFINDYLRYVWVYFLQHKSEVFAIFVSGEPKWRLRLERRVEGEIFHDIDHDAPQGEVPTEAEGVLESKEHIEEQEGVGGPMDRPPHDDQPESLVRQSSHVKNALERFGAWFPSDQVDEHDNEGKVHALIMKESEPSSFEEAQNLAEKAE